MKKNKHILLMLCAIIFSFLLIISYSDVLAEENNNSYTWPVPGFYTITSDFDDMDGRSKIHGAIDISGENIYGADVVAAKDGKIVQTNEEGWGGGYGTFLVIDHGNEKTSLYAHMSEIKVKNGDTVKKGQVIGCVGSSGDSTGAHLHFETRYKGIKYNPMDEFRKND